MWLFVPILPRLDANRIVSESCSNLVSIDVNVAISPWSKNRRYSRIRDTSTYENIYVELGNLLVHKTDNRMARYRFVNNG